MIELYFVTGGEPMWIKVVGKLISLRGKLSNYTWIDMHDLTTDQKSKLNKKHGDNWFKEYLEALGLKENMTEAEIAKDLVKDMQSSGWRLVRKTR